MRRIYTFTDKELQELVNDSTSRVFIKKSVVHISLHAYHFADLKQSLCEIFDESINHFKPELGGIVLSYRNIKVLNNIGKIINDDSRIYIDVQADYYVFSPEVGCVLTGVVNKKSSDHVGCLVHKLFNVSIPRPQEGSWDGENLEIGQKISFRVEFTDFDLNLPYIRGQLLDSSSHPEATEEPVKKKKKKKSKDKFKEEDGSLDNQHADLQANQGDDKQEFDEPQNKKKKKKDKKDKKEMEKLNQDEQFLKINAQDNSESENLHELLEDRHVSKSSGKSLTENIDWNLSRDFSDVSELACSTQKKEVSLKKKKKKSKDLDNVNVEDNITADSGISHELINSSHVEELLGIKKKKKKLFMNETGLLIVNSGNDDHINDFAVKKKPKKHKKHKQHNAESDEIPLEDNKSEEYEIPTKTLPGTQLNKIVNVKCEKTKMLENSEMYGRNSDVVIDIPNENEHTEALTSKEKNKQVFNAILQSPTAKAGKNLNTSVDNSITDSSNTSKEVKKRKLSEAKLDAATFPKKKKSIRFSTEIEMVHVQDDVQADSEQSGAEFNEEKINNGKESKSDADESSSSISKTSVASPFSSSIYSGANMVNSNDRKRKKVVKANEDVATLKQPINSISSLITSTRALLQNFTEPNIKDPTAVGLSSSSSSEETKQQNFLSIHSPQGKSGSEQDSHSSPPIKPLTQKESVSNHSRIDTNDSQDRNSKMQASEPLDISHLIARLNSSENTVVKKQEQASKSPKTDKEKKSKRKKEAEIDSQPVKHSTIDTGEKVNQNASADINSEINPTKLPNISELIRRLNSENADAQKLEGSPKSPKANKDKKNKVKKKEVNEVSTKSKHKEHKKEKKNKDKKKEDKSKKEKDKKKKEPKISKEKKKTKKEDNLTDLSRKLLQDFLKKQDSN